MKSHISRIWTFLKRPLVFIPVIILILIIAFVFGRGNADENALVVKAAVGSVQEEVSVTGSVIAAQSVSLALERGGKITSVPKDVGDKVVQGDLLVATNNSELAAQYSQARASLAREQAELDALIRGSRPEELRVAEEKVENAEQDLSNAELSLADTVRSSFTNGDNAVRNYADQLFNKATAARPELKVFVRENDLTNSAEDQRREIEHMLSQWAESVELVSGSNAQTLAETSKVNLEKIRALLDTLAEAVSEGATETEVNTTADIATYRTALTSGRNVVTTALADLTADKNNLRSAQSSLVSAKADLTLTTSGSDPQDITAQRAAVAAAQANADSYAAQLAKTVIKAPINGVVSRQDAKIGQTAAANADLVSIISDAQFQIEAFIPESDISKIIVGNQTSITLDAYGLETVFDARVIEIDPAETIVDNVPTYKTKLEFTENDPRIRPGMTANVTIRGNHKDNVLVIPQRAVNSYSDRKTVKVRSGNNVEEVTVVTGLRGSDGNIEIISGLREGQEVLVTQAGE